ncbi:hypothetical protein BC828DRAFT_394402 [Blastocladiella britannica]|nr:hypothetical protein BC828DRAFT_394402 [Blastocladiella britannica]
MAVIPGQVEEAASPIKHEALASSIVYHRASTDDGSGLAPVPPPLPQDAPPKLVPAGPGILTVSGAYVKDPRNIFWSYTDTPYDGVRVFKYGYWLPVDGSGAAGAIGCVWIDYDTNLQVTGRFTDTCDGGHLATWVWTLVGIWACLTVVAIGVAVRAVKTRIEMRQDLERRQQQGHQKPTVPSVHVQRAAVSMRRAPSVAVSSGSSSGHHHQRAPPLPPPAAAVQSSKPQKHQQHGHVQQTVTSPTIHSFGSANTSTYHSVVSDFTGAPPLSSPPMPPLPPPFAVFAAATSDAVPTAAAARSPESIPLPASRSPSLSPSEEMSIEEDHLRARSTR